MVPCQDFFFGESCFLIFFSPLRRKMPENDVLLRNKLAITEYYKLGKFLTGFTTLL